MPAYTPNLLISYCYGSAGSITFYHRDGKCRWRSKSTLSFTATPRQFTALDVHRRALAAWRTIPDTEKERWHEIARNVPPHRPPFGSGGHISGHNLFVSAYHGFVTLGSRHLPHRRCVHLHPRLRAHGEHGRPEARHHGQRTAGRDGICFRLR